MIIVTFGVYIGDEAVEDRVVILLVVNSFLWEFSHLGHKTTFLLIQEAVSHTIFLNSVGEDLRYVLKIFLSFSDMKYINWFLGFKVRQEINRTAVWAMSRQELSMESSRAKTATQSKSNSTSSSVLLVGGLPPLESSTTSSRSTLNVLSHTKRGISTSLHLRTHDAVVSLTEFAPAGLETSGWFVALCLSLDDLKLRRCL